MEIVKADFENWHVECIPDDGARISVLRYEGHDLLTEKPPSFRPPSAFYGEYETRPVYGYDDCFPSVDACIYPNENFECRDHGQLCWQQWRTQIDGNSLICITEYRGKGIFFIRKLSFSGNKLTWRFEVKNFSAEKFIFLHVMHALMPLKDIEQMNLPTFGKIMNEVKNEELSLNYGYEVAQHILSVAKGDYQMLLLREIAAGSYTLKHRKGFALQVNFDTALFPTIGIWWNNAGYPDEVGLRRVECAFEPIPGTCSNLSKSYHEGIYLQTDPGATLAWEIKWTIEK